MERPGQPPQTFTYGQLQRDVVAFADALVKSGACSDMQSPRSPNVKSIFSVDEVWAANGGLYSCDALQDDGRYNAAMLFHPGYEYVVSMLGLWSLDMMAVPLCPQHNFESEMAHMIGHSASRLLLTDTVFLSHKLPPAFASLATRVNCREGARQTAASSTSEALFSVRSVIDVTALVDDIRRRRETDTSNIAVEDVKWLPEVAQRSPLRCADDLKRRIEVEVAAQEKKEDEMREEALFNEFLARQEEQRADTDSLPLCFEDKSLSSLNEVYQRRHVKNANLIPSVDDDCLMIYTSGTTAKPKGVVHTHASVSNQVRILQDAWRWSSGDVILNVLPLHHVHGLVNVLLCSLSSHAHCIFTPFDSAARVARRLDHGDVTLFMGVPTIYAKLIDAVQTELSPVEQTGWRKAVSQNVRLMVSGSAALPVPVLERFRALSGHTLLERYGMTECGMALSQMYMPISARQPGTVGLPLPTVETLLRPLDKEEEADGGHQEPTSGEQVGLLALRSASLFDRYWNNPSATRKECIAFSDIVGIPKKHFFDTGDTVRVFASDGTQKYQIMGRTSIDIIKCRGYKLSALEIEAGLLVEKGLIAEVAVVGVESETLGEEVAAIVVLADELLLRVAGKVEDLPCVLSLQSQQPAALPAWCREAASIIRDAAKRHLAPYKIPTRYVLVASIPRNAMGKVNKKELKKNLSM